MEGGKINLAAYLDSYGANKDAGGATTTTTQAEAAEETGENTTTATTTTTTTTTTDDSGAGDTAAALMDTSTTGEVVKHTAGAPTSSPVDPELMLGDGMTAAAAGGDAMETDTLSLPPTQEEDAANGGNAKSTTLLPMAI